MGELYVREWLISTGYGGWRNSRHLGSGVELNNSEEDWDISVVHNLHQQMAQERNSWARPPRKLVGRYSIAYNSISYPCWTMHFPCITDTTETTLSIMSLILSSDEQEKVSMNGMTRSEIWRTKKTWIAPFSAQRPRHHMYQLEPKNGEAETFTVGEGHQHSHRGTSEKNKHQSKAPQTTHTHTHTVSLWVTVT